MYNLITYVLLLCFSVTYSSIFWAFGGTKLGLIFRGVTTLTAYFVALAGPLSPHWLVVALEQLPVPSLFSSRNVVTIVAAITVRSSGWLRNRPWAAWLFGLLAFRLVAAILLMLAALSGTGAGIMLGLLMAGLMTGGYIMFVMYIPVLAFVALSCLFSLPDLIVMVLTGQPCGRFAGASTNGLRWTFSGLARANHAILSAVALGSQLSTSLGQLFLDGVYLSSYAYARLFEANWFTGVHGPGAVTLRTFISVEIVHWLLFPAFSFVSVLMWLMTFAVGLIMLLLPVLHAFGIGFWSDPIFEAQVRVLVDAFASPWWLVVYIRSKLEVQRWARKLAPAPGVVAPVPYAWIFFSVALFVSPLVAMIWLMHAIQTFTLRVVKFSFSFPLRFLLALGLVLTVWVLPDPPFVFAEVCLEEFWAGVVRAWGSMRTPGPLMQLVRTIPFNFAFGWDERAFDRGLDLQGDEESSSVQGNADFKRLSTLYTAKTVNLTRRVVLKVMSRLDNFRLPEFISAQYKAPTIESLRSTYSLLADVGLPTTAGFVDSLDPTGDPTGNPYLMEFADLRGRILAQTNFRLGFRDAKIAQHPWVKYFEGALDAIQLPYISSMSFTGPREEIRSTSRYYENPAESEPIQDVGFFDDLLTGAWKGVSAQFKGSKLTSFAEIFKQWYKHPKYSAMFGSGKVKRDGLAKQYTREQFVSISGGKNYFINNIMPALFYNGVNLNVPANVFTKDETLKPQKAVDRKVRTIVGIAFPHYVRQLVTNFWPDHNYHPWQVPGKVGMAINGLNFSRIASSLTRHEKVWAGDMTAFDSSQTGVVIRLVAAVRKKGYDRVRDYDKICELIDVTYEGLLHQPLGFKNIGLVLSKDKGFTTGHGSTSADNTLALLINYLYAWRVVTGLRSREFYYYNTLVNLGDDHILGYDAVYGWTPERAMEAMRDLGTKMRNEAPGYEQLPKPGVSLPCGDPRKSPLKFLSKVWLPLEGRTQAELATAGLESIRYPSCHDPARLIGKMNGVMRMRKVSDPMTSYIALLSYIDLTSHHPELYQLMVRAAQTFYDENSAKWEKHGVNLAKVRRIPSYNDVLRRWYTTEEDFNVDVEHEKADSDDELSIALLTHDDAFAFFVRWMADFPTLLSPRYLSTRWADWLQGKLPSNLSWPLELVGRANRVGVDPTVVGWYLNRTPYQFLRSPALVPDGQTPFGVLLMRHWVFMAVSRLWSRSRSLSLFDLLRVFDNFISNVVFMLSGSLSTIVIDLDLHFLETLTVLMCSFIEFGFPVEPLLYNTPTLSLFIARVVSRSLRSVFPSGAVDLQPFDALAERLVNTRGRTCIVSAPTGTSKSTRMMERLANVTMLPVVVIQPRHLVCVGVGTYMQGLFPHSGIGIQTEGHRASSTDRLVYTTVQSLMANPSLQAGNRIFVLDEAHIQEPHYNVMRNWLFKTRKSVMFLTATPPDGLVVDETLAVPAVNSFSVITSNRTMATFKEYIAATRTFLGQMSYGTKVLIFVPTEAIGVKVAMGHDVCFLSSKHKVVDMSKNIFVSTSVADAGLTIPDVDVVWSSDVDFHVNNPDVDHNPTGKVVSPLDRFDDDRVDKGFHTISPQTIRQRQGRTGRTCDGLFYLVRLVAVPVSDPVYTVTDYMQALAPSAEVSVPYFPEGILSSMSQQDREAAYIWDNAPSSQWSSYMNIFRDYKKLIFKPSWHDWLRTQQVRFSKRSNPMAPDDVPELGRKGPVLARPLEVGVTPVPAEDMAVPVQAGRLEARWDVPGTGLLCGVHAVRGLVHSYTNLRPSFDLLHLQLMEAALSGVGLEDDADSFYGFDVIVGVITRLYHLKVVLVRDEVEMPLFSFNASLPGEARRLYLNGAHYNYFGYPVVDGQDDDDAVYEWLDANPPLHD